VRLPLSYVRGSVRRLIPSRERKRAVAQSGMMLCLILLACCALASAAETAAERGKRVVYEALQALGGDAFLRMQDRVESGRGYGFYREQLSGLAVVKIYTRYLAPVPGQIAQRERTLKASTKTVSYCSRKTARGRSPFAAPARWPACATTTTRTARCETSLHSAAAAG